MKTQLLEDIGESAQLALTPSRTVGDSRAGKKVRKLAPAANREPARLRSASGIWRQKPAGEPLISTTQQPDQQPDQPALPLDLHSVFEEIAALEAQYVAPTRQHEPVVAAAEPQHALPAPPVEPLHKPAVSPAEPTLAPSPTQTGTAPQDPLFDFTPPSPAHQAADPFTRAPTGPTRSRRRFLLWGACLLSAALLIQGGRWLYQERKDAGLLALGAGQATEKPRVDQAMKRQAMAAKESGLEHGGDVPATPAVSASRPLPAAPPPLVMLEPDPPAATGLEHRPAPAARGEERRTPLRPEPVAEQGPVSPLPKPSSRMARAQSEAAAERPREGRERKPVRQIARASAMRTEGPSVPETAMEATLRACREHGYHAAQCIKRACSVTEYGFVCRGR